MCLETVGGPAACWHSLQSAPVATHLDSFGLRAHIAPKPTELYDLPVIVDLDLVGCEHVARLGDALHLEDLHLDNPPILIASNPGNPLCGTSDKLAERIHRPARELNT